MSTVPPASMRLDKWLWAARFYKTRSLATDDIDKGRVQVNGSVAKPAKEIRAGDTLNLRNALGTRSLQVLALSLQRGGAPAAQLLYQESADSVAARQQAAEQRRLAPEPALSKLQGRPTKRDRRALERSAQVVYEEPPNPAQFMR